MLNHIKNDESEKTRKPKKRIGPEKGLDLKKVWT